MGIFEKIKNICFDDKFYYLITNFDSKTGSLYLQCKGSRTIFKKSLTKLSQDMNLVSKLPPIQSCQLAIEFLKFCDKESLEYDKMLKDFCLKADEERFRIVGEINSGELKVLDLKVMDYFFWTPTTIISQQSLLSQFSAIGAFYIGILYEAGKNKRRKDTSYIKVVK